MTHFIFAMPCGSFVSLTLVCKRWEETARRLEFIRLDLRGKWQINQLLQRVEELRLSSGEIPRSPTRWLCVSSKLEGYDRYFHRLSEILLYFGPTLHGLFLDHSGGVGAQAEGKACVDAATLALPRLRSLVLSGLARRDTIALIRACDPKRLTYLGINHHTFGVAQASPNATGLEDLSLPGLRHLSLQTIAPSADPLRKVLCEAAIGLTTLELGITRPQIPITVDFFRDHATSSWSLVKLWIRVGDIDDYVDLIQSELQPLLKLLKEKNIRDWICLYSGNFSRYARGSFENGSVVLTLFIRIL